jgi:hypothetical protein
MVNAGNVRRNRSLPMCADGPEGPSSTRDELGTSRTRLSLDGPQSAVESKMAAKHLRMLTGFGSAIGPLRRTS